MTDYLWPAVACVAMTLAYRVIMRWLGNAPRPDVKAINDHSWLLRRDFDAHVHKFDAICLEWRQKVIELDKKCDRVVIDAKNEIAGSVASVADIGKKGWR